MHTERRIETLKLLPRATFDNGQSSTFNTTIKSLESFD